MQLTVYRTLSITIYVETFCAVWWCDKAAVIGHRRLKAKVQATGSHTTMPSHERLHSMLWHIEALYTCVFPSSIMRHLEDSFWLFPEDVALFSRLDFPLYVNTTRATWHVEYLSNELDATHEDIIVLFQGWCLNRHSLSVSYQHHMRSVSSKLIDAKLIRTAIITAMFFSSDDW